MEAFDECEQVIKKQLRRDPDNVQLYVTSGKLYERQVLDDKVEEQYRRSKKLPKDQFIITRQYQVIPLWCHQIRPRH